MILETTLNKQKVKFDTAVYFNISTNLSRNGESPICFYAPEIAITPYAAGSFVGSVELGGACNCEVVNFIPHCNGTHTECVGHLTKQNHFVKDVLNNRFSLGTLISIVPEKQGDDYIITKKVIEFLVEDSFTETLIIRTIPNNTEKLNFNYSGQNPIFLEAEATKWIRENGFKHLVVDVPSVDKEEDGGELLAHKAFWNYPNELDLERTISELAFINDEVKDGTYIVNFNIIELESDASPSSILLYPFTN